MYEGFVLLWFFFLCFVLLLFIFVLLCLLLFLERAVSSKTVVIKLFYIARKRACPKKRRYYSCLQNKTSKQAFITDNTDNIMSQRVVMRSSQSTTVYQFARKGEKMRARSLLAVCEMLAIRQHQRLG